MDVRSPGFTDLKQAYLKRIIFLYKLFPRPRKEIHKMFFGVLARVLTRYSLYIYYKA